MPRSIFSRPLPKLGDPFSLLTYTGPWAVKITPRRDGKKSSYREIICACTCRCGTKTRFYYLKGLQSGRIKSCGCLQHQPHTGRAITHGEAGHTNKATEYVIWTQIKTRCLNQRSHAYLRYGGMGITICDRWKNSYLDFLADVGRRPSFLYTLDRHPDPFGNYEPGNVRWATRTEQARNRRNSLLITIGDKTLCAVEWAELYGINYNTFLARIKTQGLSPEVALSKPTTKTRIAP